MPTEHPATSCKIFLGEIGLFTPSSAKIVTPPESKVVHESVLKP